MQLVSHRRYLFFFFFSIYYNVCLLLPLTSFLIFYILCSLKIKNIGLFVLSFALFVVVVVSFCNYKIVASEAKAR